MPEIKVKFINIVHYTKRIKKKSHIIISIDVENTFNKIQHQFMIFLKSSANGIQWNFLNLIDESYENLQLQSYFTMEH